MKEDTLLSDQELNHPRPFILTGFLYPDWAQDLFGMALISKKNKSLEKALQIAVKFHKIDAMSIKIMSASCKISLAFGKEYAGVEYKITAKANDFRNIET